MLDPVVVYVLSLFVLDSSVSVGLGVSCGVLWGGGGGKRGGAGKSHPHEVLLSQSPK